MELQNIPDAQPEREVRYGERKEDVSCMSGNNLSGSTRCKRMSEKLQMSNEGMWLTTQYTDPSMTSSGGTGKCKEW